MAGTRITELWAGGTPGQAHTFTSKAAKAAPAYVTETTGGGYQRVREIYFGDVTFRLPMWSMSVGFPANPVKSMAIFDQKLYTTSSVHASIRAKEPITIKFEMRISTEEHMRIHAALKVPFMAFEDYRRRLIQAADEVVGIR